MASAFRALREEIRTLDVGKKALRSFGVLVGLVLLGIGLFVWWRKGWVFATAVQILGGLGGTLMLLGLLVPVVLRPLYRVWMALALVLGFVMTRVLLTLVFFLVVTPIALIFRVLRKDPMHRRPDPSLDTYWQPKTYHDNSPKRLEKYF